MNPDCVSTTPNIEELGCVIGNVVEALLYSVAGITLIFLIRAGVRFTTSQGDPKALMSAKAQLTWAILGFIIAIGAIALIRLMGTLVGVDLLPETINLNTDLTGP
ncbi:MAG: hypothetical protein ABIB98_01435 [bacterium]